MPLFPGFDTLQQTLGTPYPRGQLQSKASAGGPTPYQARLDLYPAYSIIEDAKHKGQKLAAGATKAEPGKLELYSGKYYAACTLGGTLACVSGGGGRRRAARGLTTHRA